MILACRDEETAKQAIDDISTDGGVEKQKLLFYSLKLESFDSINEFVKAFDESKCYFNHKA